MATLVMVSILMSFRRLRPLSGCARSPRGPSRAPAGGAGVSGVEVLEDDVDDARGLVITATTRNDAPQRGQWPMSIPNTRRKRCIQVIATRPRFARPPRRRLRTWALAPRRRGGGGEHWVRAGHGSAQGDFAGAEPGQPGARGSPLVWRVSLQVAPGVCRRMALVCRVIEK